MTEPKKITGDNVPDITLKHRLSATTTHEAGDAMPDDGTAPEIGDTMPDGTIYAGISPDTNKPMYVTPEDAPGILRWKRAMEYAAGLNEHGHKDWKLPTKGELSVLFRNRAAIGGFNETNLFPTRPYWSSTKQNRFFHVWAQYFGEEDGSYIERGIPRSSLRCVRS